MRVIPNIHQYVFIFYCLGFVLSLLFVYATYSLDLACRQLQNIMAASLCLQDGALVAGKMRITYENNNLAPNKGVTPNPLS